MPRHQPKSKKQQSNQVRIIAGEFRGRKLEFPDVEGLRPTPDRVRETVFNWLQPYLPGAVCVDLFAGTGVMGLEALSRGAERVSLVELDATGFRALQANIENLSAGDRTSLVHADALRFLQSSGIGSSDIMFLDPPYGKGWVAKCLQALEQQPVLKPGGLLYLEQESELGAPETGQNWVVLKQKQAGQVGYYLLRYEPNREAES